MRRAGSAVAAFALGLAGLYRLTGTRPRVRRGSDETATEQLPAGTVSALWCYGGGSPATRRDSQSNAISKLTPASGSRAKSRLLYVF